MGVHPTVTASTMITRFELWRKVRCHNRAVEIVGSDTANVRRAHSSAKDAEEWGTLGEVVSALSSSRQSSSR
jgi:hypothetical protein